MSGSSIPGLDLSKLAKILARLGSSHDAEVLTAARLANQTVRAAGTTWAAVVGGDDGPDPDTYAAEQIVAHASRGSLAPPVGRRWADTLRYLASRRAGKDDAENEFLDRLCQQLSAQYGYGRPFITPRQAAWVIDIHNRLSGKEAP